MFLGSEGIFSTEFIFMSCGDFVGEHLAKEAKKKKLFLPNYLKRWINIKKAFPLSQFDQNVHSLDFTRFDTIKKCKEQVNGMNDMLQYCGLEFEGCRSGTYDADNIARIALSLLKSGY